MSKEIDQSILEQANRFVQDVEEKVFLDLWKECEEAKHRAKTCGCFQCRKYAELTKHRLEMEMHRLDPHRYHPDHEEDYLTVFAIRKSQMKNK